MKLYVARLLGILCLSMAIPWLLDDARARGYSREPIKPIREFEDINIDKALLGKRLFFDKRLSQNNSVSCASCHDLDNGGDDGQKVSTGLLGRQGDINSPTVFNSALYFRQFWDGRAATMHEQVDGPVQNPVEMGSLWPEVISKLWADSDYPEQFFNVYPDGITRENIKDAIVEFEGSLEKPTR